MCPFYNIFTAVTGIKYKRYARNNDIEVDLVQEDFSKAVFFRPAQLQTPLHPVTNFYLTLSICASTISY